MNKIRTLMFFLGLGLAIAFTVQIHQYIGSFVLLSIAALAMLTVRFPQSQISKETEALLSYPGKETEPGKIISDKAYTYYGDELGFSDQQVTVALKKHFPYYTKLQEPDREKFINRLFDFMEDKVFRIHDRQPFREMPILISASAIQLSFGLKEYLFPHFSHIHVYPDAFMRVEPALCLLEGNVTGHTINISWKHFLEGYEAPSDGVNVGLHEMAHALYYQLFLSEQPEEARFRDRFLQFAQPANLAFDREKNTPGGLYSDYANKNFQEFWAESAELFFEKPRELMSTYPALYESLKVLLNQDPLSS